MAAIHEETVLATDRRTLVSWGAIFAGLAFVVASTWLLFLLGSSIGISIADASDAAAMGSGFGIGAMIWLLLTAFVAYFLGSLLTARLSGKPQRSVGMLHGITLWSVGTVLMLLLTAWGVKGLIQTGTAAVGTAISAGKSIGSAGAQAGSAAGVPVDSPLMTSVQAHIKGEIAGALADAQRSETASAEQAASAGQPQSPEQAEPPPATPPPATQREIRRALDEIDPETLVAAARPILAGQPQRAKDVLAVNTSLSKPEINAVVNGVSEEMTQEIDDARRQLAQTAEAASSYAQAVSWSAFAAGALSLLVAIAGGWLGAGAVSRLYTREVSSRTTT